MKDLHIYNTLKRKKQKFEPINTPHVGMYVCGPTVYGDGHLGHARAAITFDVVFRYLKFLGYKVRYVSNITDVGHLENDADSGEDKIQKKAQLEQLEPMEVVQFYTNRYHENMRNLNVLRPSIEPHASGHIPEQIELVEKIMKNGYAYQSNGSVYFDVLKYNNEHNYGVLSGRKVEDLYETTRELDGQKEKRNSFDFALWKKADKKHLMHWKSQWSEGYPGWHLECSAMGQKYLGEKFDIHGGGLDLQFPHHESEIAQSVAAYGQEPVKYWMHNNLITINGQKMSKSLNNFITLFDLFSGNSDLLEKNYSPMTVRFFILQAHYRSPLDFSNEALKASEKGYLRLMKAAETLQKLTPAKKSTIKVAEIISKATDAINDDFNTPIFISVLFDAVKIINSVNDGKETLNAADLKKLQEFFSSYTHDVLGLLPLEKSAETDSDLTNDLIKTILEVRLNAKNNKDFTTSDLIRDKLLELGVLVKDKKDGFDWEIKKS
ncbi:MAG: cysteine--tRNA ligase [Bacteroidales bacterium]|nr:cysteine--tRNA ligase [Bacteroidales bacterium]